MYLKHTPGILKPLAKDLVFDLPNDRNAIFLTFDDGPHPVWTPRVLSLLHRYDAKATFFLVGKQVEAHPELVEEIHSGGHQIGLHGYAHLSGWKTSDADYFADLARCEQLVSSKLFRPPYGQITLSQARQLKTNHHLIMWSDLSADWDDRYTAEQCADFATKKVKPGSIVVFHDSEKAGHRMLQALEISLNIYQKKGFTMEVLPDSF